MMPRPPAPAGGASPRSGALRAAAPAAPRPAAPAAKAAPVEIAAAEDAVDQAGSTTGDAPVATAGAEMSDNPGGQMLVLGMAGNPVVSQFAAPTIPKWGGLGGFGGGGGRGASPNPVAQPVADPVLDPALDPAVDPAVEQPVDQVASTEDESTSGDPLLGDGVVTVDGIGLLPAFAPTPVADIGSFSDDAEPGNVFGGGNVARSAGFAPGANAMISGVPEPASWITLITGLLLVGVNVRQRRGARSVSS
jgi:hypothetical protein